MKIVYTPGITPYIFSLIEMDWIEEFLYKEELEEVILIQEHEGVFSAGKSFEIKDFVKFHSFPVYHSKRGGRVTVHNPGQLVIYPILNLKKRGIGVSEYVKILENWMLVVLKNFGIDAGVSEKGIGAWTRDSSKIGFVGIRIVKGISTHGLCLNVSNDLSPFEAIIPCGIQNISITSMKKLLKMEVDMKEVVNVFIKTCPF